MAKLADLLAEQHSDPWMKDFLKASRPEQRQAARALSEALTANKRGFYDEAVEKSGKAATGFAGFANISGFLWAQSERVYAEQRKLKVRQCLTGADELSVRLSSTSYRWLQAQLMIENATCLNLETQLTSVNENLENSRKIAAEHNFPVLSLRILGIEASIEQLQHREGQSWLKGVEGLRRYYSGVYPSVRLYQFYSVLEQYSEKKRLLHAQRALLQQAISILQDWRPEDANIALTGALHLRLANIYAASRQDGLAAATAQKAFSLLSKVPKQPYLTNYVLFAKISAAETQLRFGNANLALATLESSGDMLPEVEHDFMFLDFNRVLGDSYRRAQRFDQAAHAYETGIVTAENALRTLASEADRVQWISGAERLYRGLVLNLLQQGREQQALQLWEWSRTRSLPENSSVEALSWEMLKKEISKPLPLGPHERLIYAVLEDRLQIWIADSKAVQSRPAMIQQSDLLALIEEFARECSRPDSNPEELRHHGERLGGLFLKNVLPPLDSSRPIVIELDPKLSRLPFTALIEPQGAYFDDRYSFIRSPGVWMESGLRQPKAISKSEFVLVADASPVSGPLRLPGHDDLTRTISSVFPGTRVSKPSDSRWKEIGSTLGKEDMLVFIGHGTHDGAGTALVWGNSTVNAKDFSRVPLHRLNLAVLIACSSGASGESGLFETDNLVRPFLTAGVPTVIASRWDVDSRTTTRLMEFFHRNLGKGTGVSLSLSQARQQLRKENPHPYFWAAFDLDGRAN